MNINNFNIYEIDGIWKQVAYWTLWGAYGLMVTWFLDTMQVIARFKLERSKGFDIKRSAPDWMKYGALINTHNYTVLSTFQLLITISYWMLVFDANHLKTNSTYSNIF